MVTASVLFARLLSKARLRQLQLIVLVEDLGSMHKAAEAAGLSQPAATHALSDVEDLLGVRLFERHTRGMSPTDIGKAITPMIRTALDAINSGTYAIAAMVNNAGGAVRVGSLPAAIGGILSQMLPEFNRVHADVLVKVQEVGAANITGLLKQGLIDIALCRRPAEFPQGAIFEPLIDDRLAVVAPRGHALVGKSGVSIEDLSKELWAPPPLDVYTNQVFHSFWSGACAPPRVSALDTRSVPLMFAMLFKQQLVSLMPLSVSKDYVDADLLCELDVQFNDALPPLGMMSLDKPHTDATVKFMAHLKRMAAP